MVGVVGVGGKVFVAVEEGNRVYKMNHGFKTELRVPAQLLLLLLLFLQLA